MFLKIVDEIPISTHSLTRRLTRRHLSAYLVILISTHSLTRRLTIGMSTYFPASMHFNSQPHEEADEEENREKLNKIISTHSLTRRLTL